VVLDANVYVSATIRPEGPPGRILQRFLGEPAFEIVLTSAIVKETLRALQYPRVRKYLRGDFDAAEWFASIVVLADMVADDRVINRVSDDSDDDKYIAAAVEGRASVLVTGDPDLLKIGEHAGVRILSPREFLEALG